MHRQDFRLGSPGTYSAARSGGILDIACLHMEAQGHRFTRLVYEVFNYPYVYIGLTFNVKQRLWGHLNKSPKDVQRLFRSRNKTILTSKLMPISDAKSLEIRLIAKYRRSGDWKVLNKHKGGGTGGSERIWNFEKVAKLIEGKTRSWVTDNHPGAYQFIKNCDTSTRTRLMTLMKFKRRRGQSSEKKAWTEKQIKKVLRGRSYTEIRNSPDSGALDAAKRLPNYRELKAFMKPLRKSGDNGLYWTDERLLDLIIGQEIKQIAKKYSGAMDRINNHPKKAFFLDLMIRSHIRSGKYSKN